MTKPRVKRRKSPLDLLLKPATVQQEMLHFVLVSAFDVFMTYVMLRQPDVFVEHNPVAHFFLHHWGVKGMVYFKFASVAFVCVLAQVIALRKPATARIVLIGATIVVSFVVIYSVMLFVRHGGPGLVEIMLGFQIEKGPTTFCRLGEFCVFPPI